MKLPTRRAQYHAKRAMERKPGGDVVSLTFGMPGRGLPRLLRLSASLDETSFSLQVPAVLYRAENTLNALSGCHPQGHGCREKTARPVRAYAANGT